MAQDPNNLIWIDLEMTGLDPAQDYIIEVATLITDAHLRIIAEGPVLAVHQPEAVLAAMDEWNTRHHGESGLIQRVRESDIRDRDAERLTLAFLHDHVPPAVSPMCGNSICQDRRFLARLMPELEQYFHYRNLDVSTLKELAMRWKPEVLDGLQKASAHRALEDIRESVDELKLYRRELFAL